MKSDKLQDALGFIKDEYIEEAHAAVAEKPSPAERPAARGKRLISLIAAAACVVVVITGGAIALKNEALMDVKNSQADTRSESEYYAGKPEESEIYESGKAQAVNPVQESGPSEIEKEDGVRIVLPDGAENARWTRITADPVIDQVEFKYKGKYYNYRVSANKKETDISGMYYDWKDHIVADTGEGGYLIDMNKGAEGVIRWRSGGYDFSISMTKGASEKRLSAMYQMLIKGTTIIK